MPILFDIEDLIPPSSLGVPDDLPPVMLDLIATEVLIVWHDLIVLISYFDLCDC